MIRLVGLVALGGCYWQPRFDVVAPTRHGYGGVAPSLEMSVGGESHRKWGRIGGGVAFGLRNADVIVEAELKSDVVLHETAKFDYVMLVSRLGAGVGQGEVPEGSTERKQSTLVSSFFGFAYDYGVVEPGTHRYANIGIGVSATRIWPDVGDGAWFVGPGLEATVGFDFDDLFNWASRK